MASQPPIVFGTRGSPLALAQTHRILADARQLLPRLTFELRTLRTSGDKDPHAPLANPDASQPAGLFTREIEQALLDREIDIAVHSLKDLPTSLPDGLEVAGVSQRADVREVLLYRDAGTLSTLPTRDLEWRPGSRPTRGFGPGLRIRDLPPDAIIATSSTRRSAQVRALRPELQTVPLRGNVGTRLQKLWDQTGFDATLLAAAGLTRLHFNIGPQGLLRLDPRLSPQQRERLTPPPPGTLASVIDIDEMLPAVGQGAIGLEIRADDPRAREIATALSHSNTFQSVRAERAFLRAYGGGCSSPVAAYARVIGHQLVLQAATFAPGNPRTVKAAGPIHDPDSLGLEVARKLRR